MWFLKQFSFVSMSNISNNKERKVNINHTHQVTGNKITSTLKYVCAKIIFLSRKFKAKNTC